ncbi:hypothetical protein A2276_03025 [candidate division WOR-1 bacterium RIFOXYA12_FULL_43_27]|uniref:YkuD domain-containing protein n=1 Tax=candidate division WOR-1 bacterium RIFOXYC2_FULL_46_14 TaxID=1802587 RepID=A0A1F4U7H9_UNCSA|nr:MAG: hypothetical protein A2276_03025 [candidate division WOR-1 bacterium RIFOXYA12_FULL_43_27]OGC19324.1 MAG: hypothetical protein A2292_01310 [candidate division WOR-1 bacterium RIFOXYB2_FULL_46_45]OGC30313.1 MAG: hypothetical protein A2232_01310 [candidate division WOR-1 bacterium RIFOXYA2_FULL_46_56]OGC40914.1 MAG: hypothetical protein A2438_01310 [candidate division WOR-1 bacterium RIFOXYC2_FULL_46_14]
MFANKQLKPRVILGLFCLLFLFSTVVLAEEYQSLKEINATNWVSRANRLLGEQPASAGDIYFYPSDLYALVKIIPKGTKLTIEECDWNRIPKELEQVPFLETAVAELSQTLQPETTELDFYPALKILYVLVDGKPLFKVHATGGMDGETKRGEYEIFRKQEKPFYALLWSKDGEKVYPQKGISPPELVVKQDVIIDGFADEIIALGEVQNDLVKMGVFNRENQRLSVVEWINDRLEFREAGLPRELRKSLQMSFSSFFAPEEERTAYSSREAEALKEYLTKEAYAFSFSSVDYLNRYNYGVLLNKMLGDLYKSHGCLHVSPRNSYLLYRLLPLKTRVVVNNYNKIIDEEKIALIPYLADLVNFEEDLEILRTKWGAGALKAEVYPKQGFWIIYLNGSPMAKIEIKGGPQNKMYVMQGRDGKGRPIFEDKLSYPTTAGTYYVYKKMENYLSNAYRDTTVIPMGGLLKKEKGRWTFDGKGIPSVIKDDLESDAENRTFEYFEKVKGEDGKLIQARWGSNPFGKYPIQLSPDGIRPSPELVHTSGDLMMEQRRLVDDLISIISAPKEELDDCIEYSNSFSLYKACSDFVKNPERDDLIEPLYSGCYKLNFGLALTSSEAAVVPADFQSLDKSSLPPEKIYGMRYDLFLYAVTVIKGANAYDALKERWDDISGIRKALLSDFKYFSVRDQQLFHDFIRELMLMRIDLKKLDNRDALEIFKRLYS